MRVCYHKEKKLAIFIDDSNSICNFIIFSYIIDYKKKNKHIKNMNNIII